METVTFVIPPSPTKKRPTVKKTVTVKRTPTSLSEMRIRRDRWFHYAVDHITECYEVEVTVTYGSGGNPITDKFFEFVTPYGRGCVVTYGGRDERGYDKPHGEVNAFIPTHGKALLHGFWTKRGHKVGHAGSYALAMGINPSSRAKVLHTCPAHIYDALAGGKKYA